MVNINKLEKIINSLNNESDNLKIVEISNSLNLENLDFLIKLLRQDNNFKRTEYLEKIFKELIDVRSNAILTINDLTILSHTAGSLFYVHNKLCEIYNIKNIINILYQKIDYLFKMYSDFVELHRIKIRKQMTSKIK